MSLKYVNMHNCFNIMLIYNHKYCQSTSSKNIDHSKYLQVLQVKYSDAELSEKQTLHI